VEVPGGPEGSWPEKSRVQADRRDEAAASSSAAATASAASSSAPAERRALPYSQAERGVEDFRSKCWPSE